MNDSSDKVKSSNVRDDMLIIEFETVKRLPFSTKKVNAYYNVDMLINGVPVFWFNKVPFIDNEEGFDFAALPSAKSTLDGKYYDLVTFESEEKKRRIERLLARACALDYWKEQRSHIRAFSSTTYDLKVLCTKRVDYLGNMRMFANVAIYANNERLFAVRGVRVIQEENKKAFVQWPHKLANNGERYPLIKCHNEQLNALLKARCLAAYEAQKGA